MMILKALAVLLSGFGLSWTLYEVTHGEYKLVPELFGIAAGCMLIDLSIWLLWRDDKAAGRSFIAQALIGLGVAANRVRLEVMQ